ncbi:MAG: alcohol dehydrogenase catalytic domain-containing protein [Caldiserica bacterium]|nr:alcohol dehydrogenase catalytic domain-containing protein [Caldisericota bacterium]
MKAAFFYPSSGFRLEELSTPELREGEALLEVKSCGICGTDLFKVREGKKSQVLGHEVSGVIQEVKGEAPFSVGERVFVAHHIPCFLCRYCRHGNFSLCSQFQQTNIYPGGFSQLIRIPRVNLQQGTLSLPSFLSFDEATLIEPFACVLRNIKRIKPHPEDEILIIGGGPAGIMHVILLNLLGIKRIDVVEIQEERKVYLKKFPADNILSPGEGKKDYDIAIVCAGNFPAIQEGLKSIRKGGILNIFAQVPENARLDISPNQIYFESTFIGTYSSSPVEQREVLELLREGKIKAASLITHTFPLLKIQEAISIALKGKESCKIIIHPQE